MVHVVWGVILDSVEWKLIQVDAISQRSGLDGTVAREDVHAGIKGGGIAASNNAYQQTGWLSLTRVADYRMAIRTDLSMSANLSSHVIRLLCEDPPGCLTASLVPPSTCIKVISGWIICPSTAVVSRMRLMVVVSDDGGWYRSRVEARRRRQKRGKAGEGVPGQGLAPWICRGLDPVSN